MYKYIIFFIVALALTVPAHAKNQKKQNTGKAHARTLAAPDDQVRFNFSSSERNAIQTYYRQHADQQRIGAGTHQKKGPDQGLPPGLQKKAARTGSLPPGWQKKLNRGDIIDIHDYPHMQPIPRGLAVMLPRPPEGTELMRVEDRIFRVMRATREILDVFDLRF